MGGTSLAGGNVLTYLEHRAYFGLKYEMITESSSIKSVHLPSQIDRPQLKVVDNSHARELERELHRGV